MRGGRDGLRCSTQVFAYFFLRLVSTKIFYLLTYRGPSRSDGNGRGPSALCAAAQKNTLLTQFQPCSNTLVHHKKPRYITFASMCLVTAMYSLPEVMFVMTRYASWGMFKTPFLCAMDTASGTPWTLRSLFFDL